MATGNPLAQCGAVAVLSHFGKDQEPDFHTFRVEHGKIKYVHTITACVKVANCGIKPSPAAQAASGVSAPDPGAANGSAVEAAQVAVLRQALDMERSMVNILA